MKKIVAGLIVALTALSAQADEFTRLSSYNECNDLKHRVWVESKYSSFDTGSNYGLTAPDGTQILDIAPVSRNGKVVYFHCRQPNFINGSSPAQWMVVSSKADALQRSKNWKMNEEARKNSQKDFLKSKGI